MKITDMSLRDKVLQTVCANMKKNPYENEKNLGALFFFGEIITEADEMGLDNARKMLEEIQDKADIPYLFTSDFENGCGSMLKGLTVLPYMMSLGATNDEQLAYDYGKTTALEARSIGANWTFSPVSDLNINPRNPLVNIRALTDDADLASRLLKQIVRGMQDHGLAACAKHFPGDGLDYRDQHITTTVNSLPFEEWKKLSGKIFQDLIDDGVYSIMPGHITLPSYQKEIYKGDLRYPATLSDELINKLLKKEMGFSGVVVTDALGMGGFNGYYPKRQAQVESFKAGCDIMLWPTQYYVDDMVQAVENGYVSMERLDDAVTRILEMKEKTGLFNDTHAIKLSEEDRKFIQKTQETVADNSITLIRDEGHFFPLDKEKIKKIAVLPITHYLPAFDEAKLLCEELRNEGFEVTCFEDRLSPEEHDGYDLIIYPLFSRGFRPIGFLDFMDSEAKKIISVTNWNPNKEIVVSFGSPYFGNQYFERALTYVNAYSMLSPSVKAFVRAATGKIPFGDFSPVKL